MKRQITNIFLSLYKNINYLGLLKHPWSQSLFTSSYFIYKKYLEDSNVKLIKNYPDIFKNGHVLDIGANIGYTAYVFSKALTSRYKVFAFEPEENNVRMLKNILKKYQCAEKIIINQVAVGEKEGEIEIWQNEGHHADHRVLTPEFRQQLNATIKTQKVKLITIDQFLKVNALSQPISYIKIDVQGYELAVCQGMEATLRSNPNCVVAFEYCPSIMSELGYQAEKLLHFFQERNYYFYKINQKGTLVPFNPEINLNIEHNSGLYFDILCSQRDLVNK